MDSSTNFISGDIGYLKIKNTNPDILLIQANEAREIIKITPTGDVYWNQRLVETDDDFKSAMLDLAECFKRRWF